MAGKSAYAKAAARTKTSMVLNFIERSSVSFPVQIAENITKKKLSQLIPVIGAAIGAGFNYWLINTTMTAAYMIFRKLYLERKMPPSQDFPVTGLIGAHFKRKFHIFRTS
jgi:hypothetical protein